MTLYEQVDPCFRKRGSACPLAVTGGSIERGTTEREHEFTIVIDVTSETRCHNVRIDPCFRRPASYVQYLSVRNAKRLVRTHQHVSRITNAGKACKAEKFGLPFASSIDSRRSNHESQVVVNTVRRPKSKWR